MNRSRRIRRGPRRGGLRREINLLKSSLHGHANKLRFLAPPGFSRRPFNTLTVSHVAPDAATEYLYGPRDVITYLVNQLGLDAQTKTKIVIKVRRVDAYAVPAGPASDRPSITMNVSSLTPTVSDPATPGVAEVGYGNLYNKTDLGNLSECAKLSYSFPRQMSDIPLGYTADFNFVAASANTPFSEMRFHVEWSTIGESTPTDLTLPLDDLFE